MYITRTPSGGIECGLAHSVRGLSVGHICWYYTFADTTPKGLLGMGMPEEATRNGVPERAPRNGVPEGAPRNGVPEGAPRNDVPERTPRSDVPEWVPRNGVPGRRSRYSTCWSIWAPWEWYDRQVKLS